MTTSLLLQYIMSPLLAGFVGYITNDIAIRMLFRPHKPKYIFGWQVPFTPGLIPRERGRIAKALGVSISKNLMNQEVLTKTLLNEEMIGKIETAVDNYFQQLKEDHRSIREFLSQYLSASDVDGCEQSVADEISSAVTKELTKSELGATIAHIAVEHAIKKLQGGIAGLFGGDKLARLLQEPAENLLRKNIDEMLQKHGSEMVEEMAKDGVDKFMSRPVSSLLVGKDDQLESAKQALIRLYSKTIAEGLPRMLEALNIPRIIEDRINEMDIQDLEHLIIGLMQKELKAIVWFGAALGFLIGCLNWINI